MTLQPTAPKCIVRDCDNLSALSSLGEDQFWKFTTFTAPSAIKSWSTARRWRSTVH